MKTSCVEKNYLARRTSDLSNAQKHVILMIDEIYTARRVEYDNGKFTGLDGDGNPSKTVLTFMVQSLACSYRDVVCIIPVATLTVALLREYFETVMLELRALFIVQRICADNNPLNRYDICLKFTFHVQYFSTGFIFCRSLFVDLCAGSLKPKVYHPWFPGDYLFLSFDPTHNLKNVFNNWTSKKIFKLPPGPISTEQTTSKFKDIQELYALEETKPLRIAHKLNQTSLAPNNIQKTSPRHVLGE